MMYWQTHLGLVDIYKQWFEEQPTGKLAIMIESTQSFIKEYGPDTHRRTLLSLAAHGKPEAIFVQVAPRPPSTQ